MLSALLVTAAALALGALLTWVGWRRLPVLAAYLAAVAGVNLAELVWPAPEGSLQAFVLCESFIAALRFAVVVELLNRVFAPLPGARQVARRAVLAGLLTTLALITWGLGLPGGLRATFRALALGAGGAGLLLLLLRLVALHYYAPTPPVARAATTGLGAYLVLHSLLLGAATEWSAGARAGAAIASTVAWCLWAVVLVFIARNDRRWSPPPGIPR